MWGALFKECMHSHSLYLVLSSNRSFLRMDFLRKFLVYSLRTDRGNGACQNELLVNTRNTPLWKWKRWNMGPCSQRDRKDLSRGFSSSTLNRLGSKWYRECKTVSLPVMTWRLLGLSSFRRVRMMLETRQWGVLTSVSWFHYCVTLRIFRMNQHLQASHQTRWKLRSLLMWALLQDKPD